MDSNEMLVVDNIILKLAVNSQLHSSHIELTSSNRFGQQKKYSRISV